MKIYLVILVFCGILDEVKAFKDKATAKHLYDQWKTLEEDRQIEIYFKEVILEE